MKLGAQVTMTDPNKPGLDYRRPLSRQVRGRRRLRKSRSAESRSGSDARLKAFFVGPYPPPYSGPELGMKQFLDSDLSREFSIRLLKTNFRVSTADKGKISVAAALWLIAFYMKFVWRLLSFRPDVVYYPITATTMGWLARDAPCLLLCRLLSKRTVIHLRGGHLKLNFQGFRPFVQRLVRLSCSRVSLAIVQAECLRNQFDGLVAAERIRVLPQAIDATEYDRGAAKADIVNHVLYLGNLAYTKGYCDLLRALPSVVKAVPNVRFIFCGALVEEKSTGVLFNQLSGEKLNYESAPAAHRDIQASSFREHYEWRGVVSGPEKLHLLRSCSLVALPSYSEGFSRALLEAMSVGKPIVCTPVGAHREFIVDGVNGLLVAPGDVNGLSDAIISLLSNQSLSRRIGENNYHYVRDKFDISVVSKQFGSLLRQAMQNWGGPV